MQNKVQLFCFTFAGGNSSFYDQLEVQLNPCVELIKLEYAGHGTRHRDEFYNNFCELAEDMYYMIKSHINIDGRYALMGYSMGSISAVETLKLISSLSEIPAPEHVFLAAHEPHTKIELANFEDREFDNKVMERTIQFGGIPESLVHNRIFWRTYLPVFRADYSLIAQYDFNNLNFQCQIPATVFYSETDTPFADMKQWQNIFRGLCGFVCYEGNHFFIQEHSKEMAEVIEERLDVQK